MSHVSSMNDALVDITMIRSLSSVSEEAWDRCACPECDDGGRPTDPFTTYQFLSALETSGSVGGRSGWDPCHLIARVEGEVIGVAPLYAKSHSQGEYIFDHNFAHAFENAGGSYYPKLQSAVPFTPVTGRRFLCKAGFETVATSALIQGAVQIAADNGLSSTHVTFCTGEEAERGEAAGLLRRTSQQYHWQNDGYQSWDDFLSALSSRKRKTLRKERAQAQAFGGVINSYTGDDIKAKHWDYFWRFYQDTGSRKWGSPYLTRAFFDAVHDSMRNDVLLIFAERDGTPIAGALNFIGRNNLFGRYWGCTEHHSCLHFEVCYYQAIDYAIANGLATVEAGAQGEHKLARGYLPVQTHSLHWFSDPGFRKAVEDYLIAERRAVDEEIEVLTSYGPFRQPDVDEQQ